MAAIKHEIKPEGIAEEVAQYVPTVYLEVSKEQLEMLEVSEDVAMTIKGKVVGMNQRDYGEDEGRYEVQIELQEITIDEEDNEFAELSEDE